MGRLFKLALALVLLVTTVAAQAATSSQFRAVVKEPVTLQVGPGEKFPLMKEVAAQGDVVLILGNSTGGYWMNIMKSDGTEGWVQNSKLDVYRIPPYEMDEFEEVLQRKRRVTSRWVLDLDAMMASEPVSAGIGMMVWWIPFTNGLTAQRIDQPEIGAGFHYLQRIIEAPKGGYAEMPLAIQWMFRMPPRGSLMVGPKGGIALVQDANEASRKFTMLAGVAARYFPYDNFGFNMEIFCAQRGDFFITRQVGVSFRY